MRRSIDWRQTSAKQWRAESPCFNLFLCLDYRKASKSSPAGWVGRCHSQCDECSCLPDLVIMTIRGPTAADAASMLKDALKAHFEKDGVILDWDDWIPRPPGQSDADLDEFARKLGKRAEKLSEAIRASERLTAEDYDTRVGPGRLG